MKAMNTSTGCLGRNRIMKRTQQIQEVKALRRDIDEIIQRVKALPNGRERSLVITKLQEGVMWLGMDLKRINEEPPECPCCESNQRVVKSPAESAFRGEWFCPCNAPIPAHVNQNSGHFNAPELCPNPYPESKDPKSLRIEPTADRLKL